MNAGTDQAAVVGPADRREPLPAGRPVLSKILGAVGVVLLIVGAVFAVRPVHLDREDCGSVFSPARGVTPMQCDDRLGSRGDLVTGFGAGGVALLVSAFAITAVRDRRTRVKR
ncbi:hypothetical protein AB0E69_25610 [Kribbella sp. NPDC026611]|uniref:hypothetical protein n=1 Tax=Kribbella sp. NPDC026611 TaxID=3154911 RepID=UPI0033EE8ED0